VDATVFKAGVRIAIGVMATASVTSAQAPVVGTVRDDSSGRPLSGVQITLDGRNGEVRTDADGNYAIASPSGTQIVVFKSLGFNELRIRINVKSDTGRADARLIRRSATELPAVKVDATGRAATLGRDGFAERRAKGGGKFIDSVALREREHRRMSDVLAELTGVRMQEFHESGSSISELRAVSPTRMGVARQPLDTRTYGRASTVGDASCWVSVFLDGAPMYRSDRTGGGRPPDFSRDVSVASLEAVEYYRSASEVPQQFGGGNANCGALVLWTRR
jgi:hypothetical protein